MYSNNGSRDIQLHEVKLSSLLPDKRWYFGHRPICNLCMFTAADRPPPATAVPYNFNLSVWQYQKFVNRQR